MNNRWNLLWNPFSRIAGWQALGAGLVFVVASAVIAAYGNLKFDGVLDAHFGEHVSIGQTLLYSAINLFSVILTMSLAGLTVARGFRFIDVLGTMTLARMPHLLLAILSLFVSAPASSAILQDPMVVLDYKGFLLFLLFAVLIMIWYILLMFNAFRVSTGTKGGKLYIAFIVALLTAEVVSKVLIGIVV